MKMQSTFLKGLFLSGVFLIHSDALALRSSELVRQEPSHNYSYSNQLPAFDGIYRFQEDTEITPLKEVLNGEVIRNDERRTVGFYKGDPVAVEFNRLGQAVIHLLLSDQERGVIPEKILVSKEEFQSAGLKIQGRGGLAELERDYFNNDEVEIASRRGGRKARLRYRGAQGCVAYVQRAIGWTGGRTGNGKEMTTTLKKHGWKPLSNCKNPPAGAVASWTGGNGHNSGHTAIWEPGRGWCYDLGCHDPGKKYRFKDCVAPPR